MTAARKKPVTWFWTFKDADGREYRFTDGKGKDDPAFVSQGDAETWLGETWREYYADGARYAVLYETRSGRREHYTLPLEGP